MLACCSSVVSNRSRNVPTQPCQLDGNMLAHTCIEEVLDLSRFDTRVFTTSVVSIRLLTCSPRSHYGCGAQSTSRRRGSYQVGLVCVRHPIGCMDPGGSAFLDSMFAVRCPFCFRYLAQRWIEHLHPGIPCDFALLAHPNPRGHKSSINKHLVSVLDIATSEPLHEKRT